MENNTLTHWGIKGMRWGVRRYQNADGTLTRAGKKRQAKNLAKAREAAAKKREEKKAIEEKRAELLKSTDSRELYENRHLLTTAELNDRINRISTEQRLRDIKPDTKKHGADWIVDKVDKGLKLYSAADRVYKVFGDKDGLASGIGKKLGLVPEKKKVGSMTVDEIAKRYKKMSGDDLNTASKAVNSFYNIENKLGNQTTAQAKKSLDLDDELEARIRSIMDEYKD